ncbi:MAG: helix-turn-helix domain-containing protein [Candidatus Woesearchaeota archaeon]|nr:helix-turn-helix domain-containing protein [Candidatus Woesearchaeota archaeon]
MEENLKSLGLSEKEIKVYLACLKLGNSKASEIALYAKIERQASYYILKLLMKKGFISETIKSGVQYYEVSNPKTLLEKIEEEKKTKENAIKELIEEQKKLKNVAIPKAKVSWYEGVEGFKTIIREMLEVEDKEIYSYNPEKVIKFIPLFLESYALKRKEKKIKTKIISEETTFLKEEKKKGKEKLREIKFLDEIMKGKDYGLAIAKDKVIFVRVTEKEQIGIKIEDKSFAELQKNIFNFLWQRISK